MIMGLERLDRITAFMEEHSGPPRRSSMEPIREAGQEASPSGSADRASNADGHPDSREGNAKPEPESELAQRRVPGQRELSQQAIAVHTDSALSLPMR